MSNIARSQHRDHLTCDHQAFAMKAILLDHYYAIHLGRFAVITYLSVRIFKYFRVFCQTSSPLRLARASVIRLPFP